MDKVVCNVLIIGDCARSHAFIGIREEEIGIRDDGLEDACLKREEAVG